MDVITSLQAIESNNKPTVVNAGIVQDVCHMFTQDLVFRYLSKGEHPKLIECIAEVFK
jgi:hypothetical protein